MFTYPIFGGGGGVPIDGLVSWWRFNEEYTGAPGPTRADSHGTCDLLDPSQTGSVSDSIPSGDLSVHFNGLSGDYLYRDSPTSEGIPAGAADVSVVGWFKIDSFHAIDRYNWLLNLADGGGTSRNWCCYTRNSGGQQIWFETMTGGVPYAVGEGTGITTGVWYFYHGYHDETNGINGVSLNAGAIQTVSSVPTPDGSSSRINIGRQGTSTPRYLYGRACNWAVYDRLLSEDEISWLYNSGAGRTYSDLS